MVGSNNGSYTLSSFNIVEFLPTFSEENETLVQSKKGPTLRSKML